MAAARYLDAHLVGELTALEGRGKITFPSGDVAFPQIERVVKRPVKDWEAAFLSADQSLPGESTPAGCVLTVQQKLGSDDQYARVYRLYEKLPGPVTYTYRDDADLGYVTIAKRAVSTIGITTATTTATSRTTYEPRGDSQIVSIETVETWGTTPTKKGQEYIKRLGLQFPFTERDETFTDPATGAPSLGNAHTEVIPIDANSSRVRVYDQAAANTALAAAAAAATPTNIRVILPDVLLAIGVQYNLTHGEGADGSSSVVHAFGGPSVGIGLGTPARATSSATLTAAPLLTMKQFLGAEKTPAMKYARVFMHGNFTEANLLTRLGASDCTNATVLAWPSFKPQSHVISVHSAQVSLSANANIDARGINDSSGTTVGILSTKTEGHSIETGGNATTLTVPPCLHGHLFIANPTKDSTVDVAATSEITDSSGLLAGVPLTAGSGIPSPYVQHVTATVTPTDLPATSPAAVPTSGLYLYDFDVAEFDAENSEVTAYVVDMAFFLSYTIAATPSTIGYGTIAGIGEFDPGATVTLVATATGGHSFVNWTEGVTVVSSSATYTFTAAADRVLVANFT